MSDPLDLALSRLANAGFRWDSLDAIDGGLGNRLWRLNGAEARVLRLHNPNLAFCVDREQEVRAWRAVAAIDRAPELLFWDPQFSVSRFGGTTPDTVAPQPLLQLMLDLHQVGGQWRTVDPEARIRQYLGSANSDMKPYLSQLSRWTDCLHRSQLPSGLVHGDLHRENLLVGPDGQWRAIDFEYAGQGSPLMDLAPWVAEAPGGRQIWSAYLSQRGMEASDAEWRSMRAAVALYLMMCAAWAEQMARRQRDPIYSQWRTHYFEQIGAWQP